MRGTLIAAIAAGFAILIIPGPRPALSMPATAALHYGETHVGVIQEVGQRYRYSRNWHRRPYYRGYANGYRPYGNYYRPYANYHRPMATTGPTVIMAIPGTIVGPASAFGSASEASDSS